MARRVLWEHDEGRHAIAAEPAMQEAFRVSGLSQPSFDGFDVVRVRVSERLAAQVGG